MTEFLGGLEEFAVIRGIEGDRLRAWRLPVDWDRDRVTAGRIGRGGGSGRWKVFFFDEPPCWDGEDEVGAYASRPL